MSNPKLETRNSKLRVGIYGGSGYGGSELLRILLLHPNVEISFVTANEQAGKRVSEVHRNLAGLTDLIFSSASEAALPADVDCVFLALPHGQAMDVVPTLPSHVKAIDLSGDFRLSDREEFEKHYARPHTAMSSQVDFVYGLTETNREVALRQPHCLASPRWPQVVKLMAASSLTPRQARPAPALRRQPIRIIRNA